VNAHLARSSLTGIAQFVTSTLAVLVTIPVFVHHLGPEVYGVFSLVGVVGSLNAFTNLGLNSSLVRFLAAQGKTTESDHDIIVTFGLLGAILLPITVCGIVFRTSILTGILNVPARYLGEVEWLFLSMLIGNTLILLGQTFTAMMDSLQKVYLTNYFQMIYSVLYWGLIFVVVSLGYSLNGVAAAILGATLVWFCVVAVGGLRSWGGVSFAGLRSDAARCAKKQLSYGVQMYTAGLVGFMYEPLTKILVSHFMGSTEVGIFDIGLRVRNQVFGLAIRAFSPLFPMIAQLKDPSKIRTLVHDVEQKTLMLSLPVIAVVVLTVKSAVVLFFRSNVDAIAVTIACLVSTSLIASIALIPNYQFLLAKGHVRKSLIVQSVNVIVNAAVLLVCAPQVGYYAVVAANAIATFASGGLLLYYQKRYLDSLIFDSVRQASYLCATFSIALGIGFLAGSLTGSQVWTLVVVPPVVLCATIACFRFFSLLSGTDVARYLGEGNGASRFVTRILCRHEGLV
jgi:O-antigen/teichoic acid export membrane protein